jgi:hypothetical protein
VTSFRTILRLNSTQQTTRVYSCTMPTPTAFSICISMNILHLLIITHRNKYHIALYNEGFSHLPSQNTSRTDAKHRHYCPLSRGPDVRETSASFGTRRHTHHHVILFECLQTGLVMLRRDIKVYVIQIIRLNGKMYKCSLTEKLRFLSTQRICVFLTILGVNSD